jgi:hypothetical protein
MKSGSRVKQSKFSLNRKDEAMENLVRETDKRTLSVWAIACAERVLPCFEENYPEDPRPQKALETLRVWILTGVFSMAVIRGASLAAHAAAREVGEDTAARSAARASGQAVATAHVPAHALGAAVYAQQAVWRDATPAEAEAAVTGERDWQYRHLLLLRERSSVEYRFP